MLSSKLLKSLHRLNCEMLVDLLFFLLITVSCEAQQTRFKLERNVYKRGINHSERAEFLYWHNYYRRQVENPSASDMRYVLYHKELETAALDWAVECNFQHGHFNFTRHQLDPKINIGQNIAVRIGAYSIQNAVYRWYDEYSDFSYKDKSCKPGAKCGHYEQVAGAVVTHLGCAVVYCPTYINSRIVKGDAYNIVCNYYPSGLRSIWLWKNNMMLREKLSIYDQGEPCTACPDGYKVCEDKLCRSSPACLTLDNQCEDPSNTTTCLCDASVYPVYHDSGPSPSFSQSSPKQTTVSVVKSLTSTTTKSTKAVTAPIATSTSEPSTFDSTSSRQSLQSQTTIASQILHETATKISEATSTEAVKQISRTQSFRTTEIRTLEIYTSENTKQITVTQANDDTTALKTRPTDAETRQYEITTIKTVLPEITTLAALPHITTIAATTSSGHFVSGDNITTTSEEPFSSEEMQRMCFIKVSTRHLTQNDMLPKDPGAIGDELFQRRWRQIQRPPKLSLQVMKMVDSRAVPFGLPSVAMQRYNLMVSAIACLIIWACA